MIRKISATRYLIVEAHSRLRGTLAPEHSAARSLTSPCRRGLGEDSSCICPVLSYNLSRSPEGRTGIDSSTGTVVLAYHPRSPSGTRSIHLGGSSLQIRRFARLKQCASRRSKKQSLRPAITAQSVQSAAVNWLFLAGFRQPRAVVQRQPQAVVQQLGLVQPLLP